MMTAREHIICVDDEEGILSALQQQLAPFGEQCEIDLARSGDEALELIDELETDSEPVAMVIADQIMPGMKGVELLESVHQRHPETIKILLTGQAGLNAVVHAINHAGLNRYIAKPWEEPDLRLAVDNLLVQYRLVRENLRLINDLKAKNVELVKLNQDLEDRVKARTAELASANERLSQLAITDGLTGKYNHRYFHERLALEVERSARTRLSLSLLMIDVDHFKLYNDRYGHPAGDLVLERVAGLLSDGRRVNDVVARYGGEEFAVLLIDTPRPAAIALAGQIRQRVAAERFISGDNGRAESVTISIGVAACPEDASDPARLLVAADKALYAAKRAGRNRVGVAEPAGE